jgi:hypothetical protein
MKRLSSVTLLLVLAAGQASAIERHDTSTMTCAQLTAALQSEGKSILRYPSSRIEGVMRFERYVAERQMCGVGNMAIVAKVPTSDTKSCRVIRCTAWTRSTQRF